MHIDESNVTEFKEQYCNENTIIARLLAECFGDWLEDPILDVGCGLGDIAAAALQDHRVVLLDRLPYPEANDYAGHRRLTVNFFEFKPAEHFKTVLFSHVMQFLDEDPKALNSHIQTLRPSKLIMVMNRNDGFLAELLTWIALEMPEANPEIELPGFPDGYRLDREVEFTATVSCPNFQILTYQVCYLLDTVATAEQFEKLQAFLTGRLATPVIQINERIRGYLLEK